MIWGQKDRNLGVPSSLVSVRLRMRGWAAIGDWLVVYNGNNIDVHTVLKVWSISKLRLSLYWMSSPNQGKEKKVNVYCFKLLIGSLVVVKWFLFYFILLKIYEFATEVIESFISACTSKKLPFFFSTELLTLWMDPCFCFLFS